MCVCVCVFAVARALPLSYTRVFVCVSVRRRSRAAGVFVVVEEGCSLGTQRLRHWAPLRQESQLASYLAPSLGPPSVLDLLTGSDLFLRHDASVDTDSH